MQLAVDGAKLLKRLASKTEEISLLSTVRKVSTEPKWITQ